MKSQIKRFSKSTLSVILSLCMLVSCMTVGIIATDAAYDNNESVGAFTSNSKYVYLNLNSYGWASGAKIRVAYQMNSTWEYGTVDATSVTIGGETLYRAQLPSGSINGYRWERVDTSNADNIYNISTGDTNNKGNRESNLNYSTYNYCKLTGWDSSNYSGIAFKDDVYYLDATGNSHWSTDVDSASATNALTNSSSWDGEDATKIAEGLYAHTLTSNWKDNNSIIWRRGGVSKKWDVSNTLNMSEMYFAGQNALYAGDSAAYNNCGTAATISLTSLTTPTITENDTITSGNTFAVNVTNASSIKLNYKRDDSDKTTGLIDKKYTYYVDDVAQSSNTTNTSYTIPASLLTVGTHKIKVKVSSDLTGLSAESEETTVTVNSAYTNYTGITAVAKGTTDGTSYSVDLGTIQSSTTVSSSTGLSVTAPDKTDYTFSKWVSSGSGTFDSDTSASTTFHPAANSEVATAQYKKNYTISKNSPTGGSVTLSNTSRVAGETFTVTISPDTGYVFSSLTVGGTDVTSSVSNNSYTGTASGTSDTINVVATFSEIPTTTIYVNKSLADGSFTHAHIWTTISGTNYNATGNWPGKKINSEWSLDSTHTDYYKLTFQKDGWTKFKIILSNNGSDQTTDSNDYNTGSTYYIDSATAGSAAELQDGAPEIKYTVTVTTDGNGTVGDAATATVQAGATGKVSLPEPKGNYGYVFDRWEKVSGGVTITDVTSSTSTVTATAPGTVKAKFKIDENMNLYIAGRFHVRESEGSNTWINSFDDNSANWSNTGDDNIKFTYSGGNEYKVETYASPKELSTSIGSGNDTDPYFFVYDKDKTKKWAPTNNIIFNETTTTADISNSSSNNNVRFNSTSEDTPVTLYFNIITKELRYEIPVYYTVTVSSVTGGTVTAKPARATENSAITLEVEPNDHYRLKSISAVQNGVDGALQLTETEDGYSFTMPAGNVTVTPVFEPIPYTGITYSAKGSKSADALMTDTAYTETLTAPAASGNNNPASGTYVNGINISAPARTGYTFYKWVATNGTFTKDSNVTESETASTTFYPTANGATLKALYRYNFSINLNSPTNGTITTNKTSCLAGDQYEITLTPDSGYKLKSLKINNVDIDIATSSDIVISSTGYKYTGVAGGSGTSVSVVAEFEEIPDTVIYVNKYIYNNEDLRCAYIWSTIQGEQNPVQTWPGERYDLEWDDDSNYPDYKKRTFGINSFGTFQVIFNNGNGTQTTDSDEYLIGGTYFINTATAGSKAVLTPGYPVYRIVGQQALVGSDWNASGDDNHMTETSLGSGVFTLDKTGVNKTSSGYKYKAITGNNYDYGQYPGAGVDQTIHVLYDKSNVNFTYTPSTPSLVATVSGGEFKAQTADVAHGTAVISTSSTVTGTDKSVTLSADKSYTEDNYISGYTTKSVYVKVALDPHYEVTGWTDGNGAALTPATTPTVTPSETPDTVGDTVIAQFSVDRDITIIPVVARKHHNVTFTNKPTGGTVKVNSQSSSPQSVDEFMNYTVAITPDTGYKLKTFKITSASSPATETDYTSLYTDEQKRSAITRAVLMGYYDETVTVEFEKIGYTITGTVSPNHGKLKFYEDGYIDINGNIDPSKEIKTATYQQEFWAVYTPADNYTLESIVATGGNTKPTRVSEDYANNRARFQMGAADGTIQANVVLQHSVTYYIDMHNTDMTGNKKVSIGLYDKNGTILSDARGNECKGDLTRVNNRTNVYSISIVTPFTESGSSYEKMFIKPKYNGTEMPAQELTAAQVTKLLTTKEVWLEAVNEESKDLKLTYNTKATPAVQNGYRRIYLAKPTSLTDSKWVNIGIYYWGSDYGEDGGGWYKGTAMTRIGGANADDGEYCYYYVDIPKTLDHSIGDETVKDKVDNIIFQGWSSNTRVGDNTLTPDAQTEDIKQIADSDNFFVLSKNGSTFTAEPGESVVVPDYTRYVESAQMNVNVYSTLADGSEIKINPTYTGEKITYTSSDEDVVTVDANGKITPHDSGTATITVKIYGTVGKKLNDSDDTIDGDYLEYDVTVTVRNPGKLDQFKLMALESQNYTVNIPYISNTKPGFFDINNTQITVTGISEASASTDSAIINPVTGNEIASFTVKYAKSNSDFAGYNNIKLTGNITTKSIRREGADRYGLAAVNPWKSYLNDQNETVVNCTTSKSVTNGQETVLSKDIEFSTSFDTYSAIFEEYQYVDVTFVYDYYEYVPQIDNKGTPDDTSDDMVYYQYQPEWAGANGRFETGFNTNSAHNTLKTYTVNAFEVRNVEKADLYNQDASIAEEKLELLVSGATAAIGVMPSNNYYSYSIDGSSQVIPKAEIAQVTTNNTVNQYAVEVHVHMNHSPQTYSVVLNGIPDNKGSDNGKYYYQEYAELSQPASDNNKVTKWYAVEKNAKTINTDTDPLLATGDGYEFRVKGDTYIRTQEADNLTDKTFNRSEVDFSHYEVIHRDNPKTEQEELVDYLLQNFYIADFFDPNKVFATRTIVGSDNTEEYKPEDPQFVGGGVVYFSVDGTSKLPRSSNAVGLGYVNSDGTLNKNAVKEMLKSEILSSVNEDNYGKYSVEENGQTVQKPVSYESLENAIGTEDALKVAYGTEIAAHQYVENNIKTGVLYRYLPLETFSKDSDNWSNGVPVKDEKGNYYTTLNNNTFRYSNTLQSYQYVYASGNENKETNNGRDMRLYSYYVYSYVAYNQETNVPETKYEIVLSDNYSDASTYWAGNPNPNPAN